MAMISPHAVPGGHLAGRLLLRPDCTIPDNTPFFIEAHARISDWNLVMQYKFMTCTDSVKPNLN